MQQNHPEDVFIARMARERKRRQWTLERIAQETAKASGGEVTLHQSAFTKLEREKDRRNLRLNEAHYISEALGVPLPRMLTNEDVDGIPARMRQLEDMFATGMHELQANMRERESIEEQMRAIDAEIAALHEIAPDVVVERGADVVTDESELSEDGEWWAGVKPRKGGNLEHALRVVADLPPDERRAFIENAAASTSIDELLSKLTPEQREGVMEDIAKAEARAGARAGGGDDGK